MAVTCNIVKEEIEVYNSDWVGCNPIPVQYKIESDKFPINQVDSQDAIDAIFDNDGFAQIQFDTYETYQSLEWVRIENSGIAQYNGVWQIKSIYNDLVTLDLPYVGGSNEGTIQRYYYNYFVNVRVYAGLPSGSYFEAERPTTLLTTLYIQPSPDNIAYIDVSEVLRSEFPIIKNEVCEQIEFDYDYVINDRNAWTSFYIEFQESYDSVVDNEVVTFESGYGTGNAILNTNPNFESSLAGYTNVGSDNDWIFQTVSGQGTAYANGGFSYLMNELRQSISVIAGQTYLFKIVFSVVGTNPSVTFNLLINGITVNFKQISGATAYFQTLEYVYTAPTTTSVTFGVNAGSDNESAEFYISSFEVVNPAESPMFYAINGTQQIGYPYGNNFGAYVLNDNNLAMPTKFLTLFDELNHYEGYEFNLGVIIPSELNTSDLYFRVIEYDNSGNELADERYAITNYDEGVYRLLLSYLPFENDTKYYEVFIEKLALSVYERLTEIKRVNYITDCCTYPTLVSWINYLGGWEYYMFCGAKQLKTDTDRTAQITRNIFNQWDTLFTKGMEQQDLIRVKSKNSGILRSGVVSKLNFDMLRQWLFSSIKVQKLINIDESTVCVESANRRTILLTDASLSYEELDKVLFMNLQYIESNENLIQKQ